jgi:hypothetical protein
LQEPEFLSADFDTGFIDRWMKKRVPKTTVSQQVQDIALLAAALDFTNRDLSTQSDTSNAAPVSAWKNAGRLGALRP